MPPYNIDLTQEKSDIIDYKGAGGNRTVFFTSLKKIKIYSVYIYQEKYLKKHTGVFSEYIHHVERSTEWKVCFCNLKTAGIRVRGPLFSPRDWSCLFGLISCGIQYPDLDPGKKVASRV